MEIIVLTAMFIVFGVLLVLLRRHRTTAHRLIRRNAELETQINLDLLTGAKSRSYFLRKLLDGTREASVTLIMFDIDQFKSINDTYGHKAGDKLLRGVLDVVNQTCIPPDFVARLGGDEFCVVAHTDNSAIAHDLAERLRIAVSEARSLTEWQNVGRTASFGIALLTPQAALEDVIGEADTALYAAKSAGRNCVLAVNDALRTERHKLRAEPTLEQMQQGIANNEFTYFVQPVFDVDSLLPVGVEALIRWIQADGTIRLPGEFMHMFTKQYNGTLKPPLGAANHVASHLASNAPDMFCAFNISTSFLKRSFDASPEWLDELLMGINPKRAVFEIVESAAIVNANATIDLLGFLRAQGVRIALDDFGTGYSNLSRLCDLPVDIVKLDRSLVQSLGQNRKQQAIVGALMSLSKEIGFEVIAEGVETHDQLRAVQDLGIPMAQGFYLARPETLADWRERLMRIEPNSRSFAQVP
jgi:diguanylate cyclase (GGDEF)-like protein